MGSISLLLLLSSFIVCALSIAAADKPPAGPPGSTPAMRKGPYLLYNNKNTTMTILWQTYGTPSKAVVEWGSSPSYGHGPVTVVEQSSLIDGHQFSYTIGGLSPGERCFYRVTVNGEPFTGSFLAPPEVSAASLSFYAYGNGTPDRDAHNRLIQGLSKDKEADPDHRQTMILRAGDYVPYGLTEHSWDSGLFDRTIPFTAETLAGFPIIGALGRHEGYIASLGDAYLLRQNMGQYFRKYFPYNMYKLVNRYYYSFDYGPVHVAVLDTWTLPGPRVHETPDARQIDWLREDLKISRKPWKIVMINTPVWDCASESRELQAMLAPVIESPASDVRLVIQGSVPHYSRAQRNNGVYGVTYLTLGGGGALLKDPGQCNAAAAPYVVKTETAHHFARFDITGNTMAIAVTRTDGSLVETFSIDKSLKPLKPQK
jgi:hypothetical protein